MLNDKFIASFEKVSVVIRFLDEKNKKRTLEAKCNISFTMNQMKIVARKYLELIEKKEYKVKVNTGKIPKISMVNIHQILDLAKKSKVPWALLMNFSVNINKVTTYGLGGRVGMYPGSLSPYTLSNLLLNVETPSRIIGIEIIGGSSNPSKVLIMIDQIIKKYSTKPIDSQLEIAERNLANKNYVVASSYFLKAAGIYEEIGNFESAMQYYRQAIEASYSTKEIDAFNKFVNSSVLKKVREPNVKMEILKEVVNKFLDLGQPKKAVGFIKKIITMYQQNPFQDSEKVAYYEELAKEIMEERKNTMM
ncbi:MAG TPA: hypothetical protein VMV49_02810 [Candidatus Deferrimicrobium sp.]|nr:hypothetical protein [Candidatus Deferrimicrobium sp.]